MKDLVVVVVQLLLIVSSHNNFVVDFLLVIKVKIYFIIVVGTVCTSLCKEAGVGRPCSDILVTVIIARDQHFFILLFIILNEVLKFE